MRNLKFRVFSNGNWLRIGMVTSSQIGTMFPLAIPMATRSTHEVSGKRSELAPQSCGVLWESEILHRAYLKGSEKHLRKQSAFHRIIKSASNCSIRVW